jgi:hypothetical protein
MRRAKYWSFQELIFEKRKGQHLYFPQGEHANVGSLFSKFSTINHPVISEFISSIPENLADAVQSLSASGVPTATEERNMVTLDNRRKLKEYVLQFHNQANTLTPAVISRIAMLDKPSIRIFVTLHQPNFFAYSGVFKKIVLLDILKERLEKEHEQKNKIINLFLVIDHDFIDETWVRLAQLPSVRNSTGILELRYPYRASQKWRLLSEMSAPSRQTLHLWKKEIKKWIDNSSQAEKHRLMLNFENLWQLVEDSSRNARSFSDFNSFFMSNLVNNTWRYDTLFARLSDLSIIFKDGFKFLLYNFKEYSDALREAERCLMNNGINHTGVSPNTYLESPLWIHCRCGSKSSSMIKESNENHIVLLGKCMSCRRDLRVSIGDLVKSDFNEKDLCILSPKAIPILLLITRDLGADCYVSGSGGTSYAVYSSIAYNNLSIKMPLFIFWPSTDIYDGFGQVEALQHIGLTHRSEVIQYIERLNDRSNQYYKKIAPLLEERKKRFEHKKFVDDLLSHLFVLKEQQREVRHLIKVARKVINALSLKACIIDYAVNFGLQDIERVWRNSLIDNDSLSQPLVIQKKF